MSSTSAVVRTITHSYPLENAILAANAVLPHISKDDVTPVITAAKLAHGTWLATDRYTVAQFGVSRPAEGPLAIEESTDEHILLRSEAVEWIAKIMPMKLRNVPRGGVVGEKYSLTVSQELREPLSDDGDLVLGDVTVAITFDGKVERSQSFDPRGGDFPLVDRLLVNWKPATKMFPYRIEPAHLERVSSFAKRHYKYHPLQMEAGAGTDRQPGPLRVTVGALTAIIQPHLLLG